MTNALLAGPALDDLWARATRRAEPRPDAGPTDALVLSTFRLGLEQTLSHLGQVRPDRTEFLAWVVATAGTPSEEDVARLEATLAGSPAPPSTAARLAQVEAMPPALDPTELERFERDGYAVLRGALTSRQASAAADAVLAATGAELQDPTTWYGGRTNQIMVQLFQHPALDVARRSARVHKAFAQLWGTSDLWVTTDRASFNPPLRPGDGFAPPRLHWDVSLARPVPFATQGILYLTDTSEDQGALELVPGFHHRLDSWLDGLGTADPRSVDLSAGAVRVAAGAGDLVIWRQDLPHGASPNHTDRPRVAQYLTMFPASLRTHPEWR